MSTFVTLLVFSQAVPGQEEAYERWYDEVHIVDMLGLPSCLTARRIAPRAANASGGGLHEQNLAIYEFDADDPAKVREEIAAAVASDAMTYSPALDRPRSVLWFGVSTR